MQSSVQHVHMDNLQAVPPVQQPDDLLIYTPIPQIKVQVELFSMIYWTTRMNDTIFEFLFL